MHTIEKLDKRCPFCGSEGVVACYYTSDNHKYIWVGCSNYHCFCGMHDEFVNVNDSDRKEQERWIRDSKKQWNRALEQESIVDMDAQYELGYNCGYSDAMSDMAESEE